MEFDLLDGYLLGGTPAKGEVIRRLLESPVRNQRAAPFYEGMRILGARTPDLSLMALRLVLAELEIPRPRLGRMGRTALAAGLLGCALGVLRLVGAPLGVLIAAACVLYPALLFGLGALHVDDVRLVLRRGSPA